MSPVTVGPDGVLRCYDGEQARLNTSRSAKNPGRQFYGCPKRPLSAQCDFFCWADDDYLQQQFAQFGGSQPTSAKRKFQSMATPPDTAAEKRLRLQHIQAGLREREQDQTDTLPFTAGTSDTQTSDTPTEPAQNEARGHRYSFLGLSSSQESAPSTPKRLGPLPQLYGLRAEPVLPTPLETLRPDRQGSSRQDTDTPTQRKGKERASSQWGFNAADSENPFDEAVESDHGASGSPTAGERIANAISGLQGAFRTFGDEFNKLDAVNYIQRLERQKCALELKDDAKSRRITDLEIECDVLREKLRRLEEKMK